LSTEAAMESLRLAAITFAAGFRNRDFDDWRTNFHRGTFARFRIALLATVVASKRGTGREDKQQGRNNTEGDHSLGHLVSFQWRDSKRFLSGSLRHWKAHSNPKGLQLFCIFPNPNEFVNTSSRHNRQSCPRQRIVTDSGRERNAAM